MRHIIVKEINTNEVKTMTFQIFLVYKINIKYTKVAVIVTVGPRGDMYCEVVFYK